MSSKKAARKQRTTSERERQRSRRRSVWVLMTLVVVAVLLVLATAMIFGARGVGSDDDLVWSPEHGHWHRR